MYLRKIICNKKNVISNILTFLFTVKFYILPVISATSIVVARILSVHLLIIISYCLCFINVKNCLANKIGNKNYNDETGTKNRKILHLK